MTEGSAVIIASVISSVITVGGMFASIVYNSRQNKRQRKHNSKEKFFYEVYPKRIAAYEDVIRELAAMGKNEGFFSNPATKMADILYKIENDIHTLEALRARLELYGSPAARSAISILWVEMGGFLKKAVASAYFGQISVAFFNAVNDTRNTFLEFVRKEAGANVVDRTVDKILENFASKKRKKKKLKR